MVRSAAEQELQDNIALKVFDGDESALEDILAHYGPQLSEWLLSTYSGAMTAEDVEEILCDTVRKFWSCRTTYDDRKGSIRTLLFTIAKNLTIDVLHKGWQQTRKQETNVDMELLAWQNVKQCQAESPDTSEKISDSQKKLYRAVRETLAELPELQRKILEHDALAEDDADANELGRRLGGIAGAIAGGTIRANRLRGKEAFRRGMKNRGYDFGRGEE